MPQHSGARTLGEERSTNSIDKEIGERVRARRLELGMSQEKLADLLGVTFQQVQKYEKGVNRIAASRLHDICGALDVAASYFYENLPIARRGAKDALRPQDSLTPPGAAELVRLFASIESDKVRRRVLELVRAMAAENS